MDATLGKSFLILEKMCSQKKLLEGESDETSLRQYRALEEAVYGFEDEVGSNALEASVSRLRRALEAAKCPTPIVTVRGIGWMLPREESL